MLLHAFLHWILTLNLRSKMASIITIEGIGPVMAEKLLKAGIKTTEGLLKAGGDKTSRKKIADAADIDEKKILRWVNMADLFRIKGVAEEYSDLLEAAGVDTVKELATRKPDNLHAKMVEVNADKKLVRQLPTPKKVASWVAQAKELVPAVTY
jgi:predicted flap endonuclease-1-like 5' DNA nuclease